MWTSLISVLTDPITTEALSGIVLYLAGAWLHPLVAGLPKTKRLYRVIRFLHRVLDEVDPENDQNTRDSNRQTDSKN